MRILKPLFLSSRWLFCLHGLFCLPDPTAEAISPRPSRSSTRRRLQWGRFKHSLRAMFERAPWQQSRRQNRARRTSAPTQPFSYRNSTKDFGHSKSLLGGFAPVPRGRAIEPFWSLGKRTGTNWGSTSHGQFEYEATFDVESWVILFHCWWCRWLLNGLKYPKVKLF